MRPLDPTLQIRRWFERRPVILAAAARASPPSPWRAPRSLYVLPVMLVALELGLVGGLVAAAAAAVAAGTPRAGRLLLAVGAVAGRFSDQMRSLLEQRRGLGHLLDAQEDDRRRHAETLHEELAQVLAAVLINLRMLRRQGVDDESLDELHDQVVGVLEEVRDLATELRPSSLAQLGLVPALQALDGVSVEAGTLPEPVPGAGAHRCLPVRRLGRRAGRARAGCPRRTDGSTWWSTPASVGRSPSRRRGLAWPCSGSLTAEPQPAGRTRLRVRLPLQAADGQRRADDGPADRGVDLRADRGRAPRARACRRGRSPRTAPPGRSRSRRP